MFLINRQHLDFWVYKHWIIEFDDNNLLKAKAKFEIDDNLIKIIMCNILGYSNNYCNLFNHFSNI